MKEALRYDVPKGAYIIEVVADSPASKAGVQAEDIIVKIDGKDLDDKNDLGNIIAEKKVGDKVELEVWRATTGGEDGETLQLTATLSEFEE